MNSMFPGELRYDSSSCSDDAFSKARVTGSISYVAREVSEKIRECRRTELGNVLGLYFNLFLEGLRHSLLSLKFVHLSAQTDPFSC
jgi:hypothetical protein